MSLDYLQKSCSDLPSKKQTNKQNVQRRYGNARNSGNEGAGDDKVQGDEGGCTDEDGYVDEGHGGRWQEEEEHYDGEGKEVGGGMRRSVIVVGRVMWRSVMVMSVEEDDHGDEGNKDDCDHRWGADVKAFGSFMKAAVGQET